MPQGTAIEEVNRAHRDLIRSINAVHDSVAARISAAHIAHEEEHIAEMRYISCSEHKEDHGILLDDLRDIIEQLRADGRCAAKRLSSDLEYWFSVIIGVEPRFPAR